MRGDARKVSPPPTISGARDLPVGPATVPHRKNAAEWVMWVVLWPAGWLARRFRARGGT